MIDKKLIDDRPTLSEFFRCRRFIILAKTFHSLKSEDESSRCDERRH